MSIVKIRSASAPSSTSTWSRVRVAGSIVVTHSWSAFISPRPLNRWTLTFLVVNSRTTRSRSFSDWAYFVTFPVEIRYSGGCAMYR